MAMTPILQGPGRFGSAHDGPMASFLYHDPQESAALASARGNISAAQISAAAQESIARGQQEAQKYGAQLQYNASVLPEQNRQARFNQVFPLLQGQFNQLGQGPATAGGTPFPATSISTGNPWSRGMTQQSVNASRAFGDKALGTQMRSMRENLGARGQEGNAALSNALGGRLQMGALSNSMNQVRGIKENAAQQNVGQRFKTDTLREQQRAALDASDIERRKPYFGRENAIIGALSGLL